MNKTNVDGVLTIFLKGDIDAQNAADLQQEIFEILDAEEFDKLILDAGKVDYISSAGLKLLLVAKKKTGGKMSVANATPFVRDILKMAGFQHFMDIEDE